MNDENLANEDGDDANRGPARWMQTLGVVLILLSGVCFFTMLSVPWFPLSTGQKSGLAAGLFVGVQVFWWVGAAMVGPAAFRRIKLLFARKR